MGRLTTHVLDTGIGKPAADVAIELHRLQPERHCLISTRTNCDGRCDAPLLENETFLAGEYELIFHMGDYFQRQALALPSPPFVDTVVLRFGIARTDEHYHVPLLVSPWGYTTYRGS